MTSEKRVPQGKPSPPMLIYDEVIANHEIGWYSERPFLRELGKGGQGVVFLSVRRGGATFSLPIALKLFSPDRYRSWDAYNKEMWRTARVASRVAEIQHDNLIDVQNFLSHRGIFLLEMEWIDGHDLRCLLDSQTLKQVRDQISTANWRRLNETVITEGMSQPRIRPVISVGVVRECLRGLAALHRAGIVHNDLKPANIMLKRSGNVKLVDIGSAYEIAEPPQGLHCTPIYAAPEVLGGQLGSPLSDLASLGYVLIEMLSGVQPFKGMPVPEIMLAKQSIMDRLPYMLPIEEFAYSEMLLKLIRGLVDPDPNRRFPSAEAADLDHDGASSFLNELVKGDFDGDYAISIRKWIERIDEGFLINTAGSRISLSTTGIVSRPNQAPEDPPGPQTVDFGSDDQP